MIKLESELKRMLGDVVPKEFGDPSTPEARAKKHDEYMEGLQKATRDREAKDICYFSWKLKNLVVFAANNGFYSKERVDAAVALLEHAAEATKGTFVEKHCAQRAKAFLNRFKLGMAVHDDDQTVSR